MALLATLLACRRSDPEAEFYGTRVTLPNGHVILAEALRHPTDMMRHMMFRESLAEDRGMLLTHGQMGNYSYWMYQVKVPLDIVWMDQSKRIVEIVTDVPPCPSKSARECPVFGGKEKAIFVLQLAAGTVKKQKLELGQTLSFY